MSEKKDRITRSQSGEVRNSVKSAEALVDVWIEAEYQEFHTTFTEEQQKMIRRLGAEMILIGYGMKMKMDKHQQDALLAMTPGDVLH